MITVLSGFEFDVYSFARKGLHLITEEFGVAPTITRSGMGENFTRGGA